MSKFNVNSNDLLSKQGVEKIIEQWSNLIKEDRKKLLSQFGRLFDDFEKNVNNLKDKDFSDKTDKWKICITKVSKYSVIYKKSDPLNMEALLNTAGKTIKETDLMLYLMDLRSHFEACSEIYSLKTIQKYYKDKKTSQWEDDVKKVKKELEDTLKKYDKKAFLKFKITKKENVLAFLVDLIKKVQKDLKSMKEILKKDQNKKIFMTNLSEAAEKVLK